MEHVPLGAPEMTSSERDDLSKRCHLDDIDKRLGLLPLQEFAKREDAECYRLYRIGGGAIVSTLLFGSDRAVVEVSVTSPSANDIIGGEFLPLQMHKFAGVVGKRSVDDAQACQAELLKLGVWSLPDCPTDVKDAFAYYHIAANTTRQHSVLILDPQTRRTSAFAELINFYSARFLDHKIDVIWAPPSSTPNMEVIAESERQVVLLCLDRHYDDLLRMLGGKRRLLRRREWVFAISSREDHDRLFAYLAASRVILKGGFEGRYSLR